MTDKFIGLLGLCRRAGKLILGAEDVVKHKKRCAAAYFASDASERTRRVITQCGVPCFETGMTKADLGKKLGCHEVAVAAVTDTRFAEALNKNILGE